jgi:hypothetical protein
LLQSCALISYVKAKICRVLLPPEDTYSEVPR